MKLHNNSALLKRDNKNCKAVFRAAKAFGNSCTDDYFIGITDFYEFGLRLFSIKADGIRLNEEDALQDALQVARDNGF